MLKEAERELLKFSKMDLSEIEVRKVIIDDQDNHVTTLLIGDPSLPFLVIIHGYGGSSVLMYRLFKDLSRKFRVIAIDILGMGSSSRPPFDCQTPDEADKYCMEFLEKWRLAMKDLDFFVLVGHSYGGYLAGTYASLYPHFIKKLILLSPLGLKKKPEGF